MKCSASEPPQSDPESLFMTAFDLARADPEQPRIEDGFSPTMIEPDRPIEAELKAAREEIARLREEKRALAEENRRLRERAVISDPEKFFDLLESISMNTLAPILEHEATDQGAREIARELRVRPDELRHYLIKGKMSYLQAIAEMSPFLDAAKNKLLARPKRGAAETNTDHRAKLLLEKLDLRREIRIDQAILIIEGDEGTKPDRTIVRRAMKRAAQLEPDKAIFIPSWQGGVGAVLKRRE